MVVHETATRRALLARIWRALGSMRLAVGLIVLLAVVLAWATILESARGREYAQWFVYNSHWFVALLGLLGLNIWVATLQRFPWKGRISFLVTHAGLLLLLLGSIQTFMSGVEGQLTVAEGESASSVLMPTQTRLTAVWPEQNKSRAAAFIFRPGPVQWPDGKTLDLGELDGVQLRVLKFLSHAVVEQTWVRDESRSGEPALHFALRGSDGSQIHDQWLLAEQFGGVSSIGPTTFEFQKLPSETMLEDFLNPPEKNLGKEGILAIHHAGKVQRVPVQDVLGKPIVLAGSEITVTIEKYLPNAMPDGKASFRSEGDRAENPMLELLIRPTKDSQPTRQIAFARHPLLNFDGIHGWTSPVKFWYHHPESVPEAATQFVQTLEGKLYCRTVAGGKYVPQGEVELRKPIPAAAGFQVVVLEHFPSAREQVSFHPVASNRRGGDSSEAAALLEVRAGGATQSLWLKRQDPTYGSRSVSTPEGPLAIGFGYDQLYLPFSLELLEFERGKNPGRMGDASFKSHVRIIDEHKAVDEKAEISMNSPLTYDKFTFYQSSFQELPSGKNASVLSVAYDPGRFMKYLGSLLISAGCFAMFYARAIGSLKNRWHFGQPAKHTSEQTACKDRLNSTAPPVAGGHSSHSPAPRGSQLV